jgi:transcriptional regulator with XRE-family HTH domain
VAACAGLSTTSPPRRGGVRSPELRRHHVSASDRLDAHERTAPPRILAAADGWERSLVQSLRRQRQRLGWSLQDAARRSGGWLTPSTLGAYERGERQLSVHKLALLAQLYETPVRSVLPVEAPSQREREAIELAAILQQMPQTVRTAFLQLFAALAEHDRA